MNISSFNIQTAIAVVLAAILGLTGFMFGKTGGTSDREISALKAEYEQNIAAERAKLDVLPLDYEVLQNPLLTSWQASVIGKISVVNASSITIEDNGHTFTAAITERTRALKLPETRERGTSEPFPLEALLVGDTASMLVRFEDGMVEAALISLVTFVSSVSEDTPQQ